VATCLLVSEHEEFGKTYCLNVVNIIAILKIEAVLSFETLVQNYQIITQRHSVEDRNKNLCRCEELKPQTLVSTVISLATSQC
jgi:hypothetical protein